MESVFLLLLLVTAATASPTAEESGTHSFQRWMAVHGRSYTAEELPYRLSVYEQNMRRIHDFNTQAASAGRTYVLGEGPYTDLTEQEFRHLASTRSSPPVSSAASSSRRRTRHVVTADEVAVPSSHDTHVAADEVAVPSSVDWRQTGAVTPVKQQGACGSCWAFAAVAAIEGLHKIQYGELLSLSEQQLIDCSAGGTGCIGGFAWKALEWVVANGGIAAEGSYPYTSTTGVCDPTRLSDHAATLSGFRFVDSYNEKALMSVVAKQPVVVSVAVHGGSNIQRYKGGIYNGPCIISPVDHDLTVVGYGQDEDGTSYWIAKNSWGPTWGDSGYIYIQKDVKQQPWGLCGLALQPVYPVM